MVHWWRIIPVKTILISHFESGRKNYIFQIIFIITYFWFNYYIEGNKKTIFIKIVILKKMVKLLIFRKVK